MAKKSPAVDVGSLIASGAKKKKATKSKSKTPVIDLTDENEVEAIAQWLDAKEREKTAKSDKELAQEVLMSSAMAKRREHIQESGSHTRAVKLNGKITMTCSKRYSDIPTDNEEELREIFGDEEYDKFFVTNTQISFKNPDDTEVLTKIVEAIGAENFHDVFEIIQTIKPNGHEQELPPLVAKRDSDPEVAEKHDQAVDEGLIKPYSPSFRK